VSGVAVFLAQVVTTPTPEAVDVRIVDNGGGLPVKEFLVAIFAFLGVLYAARMNRKTLGELEADRAREERNRARARELYESKLEKAREQRELQREKEREAREEALDEKRAQREERLERWREARELEAEKRLAIGAARVLKHELWKRQSMLEVCIARRMWWPQDDRLASLEMRHEDQRLLATWFLSDGWEIVALGEAQLQNVDGEHAYAKLRWSPYSVPGQGTAEDPKVFEPVLEAVLKAAGVVAAELQRLGEADAKPGANLHGLNPGP
jgi:hypothetical protein